MSISSSRTEDAYRTLRGELLACRLPPGGRLKLSALSNDFGYSLGAVREALSRLSSEGFVRSEPQRGFTATPVSADELTELTEARIELDSICIRKSIESGDLDWEAELVATAHRLKKTEADRATNILPWRDAHAGFHSALVAGCKNQTLLEIRNQLFERSERYRQMSLMTPNRDDRVKQADIEHQQLFDAVLARDTKTAIELVSEHIDSTTRSILEAFAKSD